MNERRVSLCRYAQASARVAISDSVQLPGLSGRTRGRTPKADHEMAARFQLMLLEKRLEVRMELQLGCQPRSIVQVSISHRRPTSSFFRACMKRRWIVLRLISSGCRKPADRSPCKKIGSSSGFVLTSKSVFRGTSRVSDRLGSERPDEAAEASRLRRHHLRRGRTCRVCTWKAVAGLWVGFFEGSEFPRRTSGKASSSENEPEKVKESQH